MRLRVLVVVLGLFVVACGGGGATGGGGGFDALVDDPSATCGELFAARNALPDGQVDAANVALREIGCFSSTSTRTD